MSATRSPRDLVNPKHIQDRLPSLMGWFSECNTFSVLEEACHVGRLTHERKIYVLRGHSHSVVDGGFIIDPPSDFPSQDPSRAWKWLEQHRNSATIPVRIYRFDAKLNLTSWKSMQWAPFYLVTVADFPEYLCLVPSTAYMNLYAVHRRSTFRTQLNRLGSDSDQHVMVFDNLLALYAVHRDHIYQALVNVVDASSMKTSYVNPTNKVEFCGWNVPQPDITVGPLLRIHEKSQIVSRDSIHRLSGLLETSAGIDLELLMNPLDPLICDFTIWDKQNDVFYLIEHKTRVKTGDKQKDWWDPRHNWHYMLYQQGDDLTIYTRQGERQQDADATPPYTIDISARDAAQRFAVHIRKNGAIARSRLSNKWNKKTGLHESSTSDGEDESESPLDLLKTKSNVLGTQKHTDIRLFASIFASRFNDQCWKLSEHGCILLDNHPSADAAILEHAWTPNEQVEYKKNGTLPVSLVSPSATRQQCVLLRFIPHIEHARAPSTSRLFELSMQTSFAIPACSSQHLMFVASSGGIGTPSDGDFDMDKLVLLSSVDTTMLDGSGTCVPCEDRYQQKRTTFVDQTIGLMDLRAILKDQTAKGTRPVSLTQAPFLKADIQPALKLFSFREGEVHQYFCDLFIDGKSELIDDVYGLHGLLQRQWNHGDSRKIQRLSVDRLMHRILSTLPKQSESFSIDTFKQDLDQKTTQIAKDKSITTVKLARRYALGELINGSDRGIALGDIVEQAGFSSDRALHCDHCSNVQSCKFLHPEISTALHKHDKSACGCCLASNRVCAFQNMPTTLQSRLKQFEHFRAHVPCQSCWAHGKLCDNSTSACEQCIMVGSICEREACIRYEEPRDESFCSDECDRVHCDDGYRNVVYCPREGNGVNVRLLNQRTAQSPDHRKAVCSSCYRRGWDTLCAGSIPCKTIEDKAGAITLSRNFMKCYEFTRCTRSECTLAHATQGFAAEELDEYDRVARGKRQDLRRLARQFPLPGNREVHGP